VIHKIDEEPEIDADQEKIPKRPAVSINEEIESSDFVLDGDYSMSAATDDNLTMREYELKILKATLRKYNNNINLTARQLDISVSTIYRMLKEQKSD